MHHFIFIVASRGDPSMQNNTIEIVWQVRCVLSLAVIMFLCLLFEGVVEIVEETDQKVDTSRANSQIHEGEKYAEDLVYCCFRFVQLNIAKLASFSQYWFNVGQYLWGKTLAYQSNRASFVALRVIFFNVLAQFFEGTRIEVNSLRFLLFRFDQSFRAISCILIIVFLPRLFLQFVLTTLFLFSLMLVFNMSVQRCVAQVSFKAMLTYKCSLVAIFSRPSCTFGSAFGIRFDSLIRNRF